MVDVTSLLACPRCDKQLALQENGHYFCGACKVEFPTQSGMPWLFAEPAATLGEWRGRLHFALQQLTDELAGLERELQRNDLQPLTEQRVVRYKAALEEHRRALIALLQPLDLQALGGRVESYLALRTRLPVDQGLNTYYANIHRDWAWGEAENTASLQQIRSVLGDHSELGNMLVLGAGAGRLAYDIHTQLDCATTIVMDFNPLLMLVAKGVTSGETLELYEFPIAPKDPGDDAVLRKLKAPAPADENFHLLLGDALRPPFLARSFDTVVTPWLIDIINDDLPALAARINNLLSADGRWLNFGSLAFAGPERARRFSTDETRAIVASSGFAEPRVHEETIPYMCSPASRHGRQETVFSFAAAKTADVKKPERYRALPEWLVTGKEPVPQSPSFRTQAMTTQVYAFIMSLIDGKRSIRDMATVLEAKRLMSKEEAEPAIRSFLTKMHDDAERQARF
ncbi:MAG: hypothetical protein HKN64_02755 [Woeseiaceae bacterium]|nr:hypothetical protein [Woeseiaceae bacterium]